MRSDGSCKTRALLVPGNFACGVGIGVVQSTTVRTAVLEVQNKLPVAARVSCIHRVPQAPQYNIT